MRKLQNLVGGQYRDSSTNLFHDVINPATTELLAKCPMSNASDVDEAVSEAKKAFLSWRDMPPMQRARYLFRFKGLLDKHKDEIANICTAEHGKALSESLGDVGRGIENVEHACGIPKLMMGSSLENIANGIDCVTFRQPLGVFAAIAPFNFPAMVPLWFMPYAVATGNTFVLKPSEQVPLTQDRIFELAQEAGFPPGVISLVHGGKEVVDRFCTNEDIKGVSFVGSTKVAKHVYALASQNGKRVQALGGAKNFTVVMPDANFDESIKNACESMFGCSGQRCLAGSMIIAVGDSYEHVRTRIVAQAKNTLIGPVVSSAHLDRVLSYIQVGISEGASLLLDGRETGKKGFYVGPTIFDNVLPPMRIAQEEIFGPVGCIMRAKGLDQAISMINDSAYANAASIFTGSGKAASEFKAKVHPSMVGINIGVAAPMAMFPFGGNKNSFFGTSKAHGDDAIAFYTDNKVVMSRWF